MVDLNIPDRGLACEGSCAIGDICATVGTQSACGSCCACRQRCQVTAVQTQLSHPLVSLAAQERVRQREQEGRTLEHDDRHTRGELTAAAATYAYPPELGWPAYGGTAEDRDALWPFEGDGFKPSPGDRTRELAKAMALLMAEHDRLSREELLGFAQEYPVLVPRQLCDQYQEIWDRDVVWLLEVEQRGAGYLARVAKKGGGGAYPATGETLRRAVFAVLVAAGFGAQDAGRMSEPWPDVPPPRQFSADDIAAMLEVGGIPEPDPAQLPARGYHPDQAIVETDPPAEG